MKISEKACLIVEKYVFFQNSTYHLNRINKIFIVKNFCSANTVFLWDYNLNIENFNSNFQGLSIDRIDLKKTIKKVYNYLPFEKKQPVFDKNDKRTSFLGKNLI